MRPLPEAEYLNKGRFPLTTQGNLPYEKQKMIDSYNYQAGVEHLENGGTFNPREEARLKELMEKLGLPDPRTIES